jgi:protein gp37
MKGAVMAKDSGIQWTTHTFNPWWGCEKVSEACKHCYAESFAKRVGEKVWGGDDSARRFFGDKHWAEPLKWARAAEKAGKRHRVFCASMADVFEDRRDLDAARARLWALIEATPALDWLLLSKRWGTADIEGMAPAAWRGGWPANVWAGATVENQARAEERIPALIRVPARVRFLSMEPLLGPVDLEPWLTTIGAPGDAMPPEKAIHLVILGGESGAHARPLSLGWMRALLAQARAAGVAGFVKQFGEQANDEEHYVAYHNKRIEAVEDGMVKVRRVSLVDRHGGEPEEWPADLRVREMPVRQ